MKACRHDPKGCKQCRALIAVPGVHKDYSKVSPDLDAEPEAPAGKTPQEAFSTLMETHGVKQR